MIRERVAVCFGVIVAACILIAFVYGGTAPILASLALWAMWFIALHRFIPRQQVPQLPSGTAGEGFLARVSAPFRNWWTDAGAFLTGITGLLIFIVWAGFEGLPHPSIDPFTSIQISLALLAAAAVLVLWSGALLLGDPDDGVPGARSFSNRHALLRILIFLAPLVSTCIYIELGVPPGSSLWYNLTLGLILFVWFGLSLTLRKRWLWVWSVSFAGTLIILPPAVTYLQARAVFLALQPIVELNPSSVGCAGPALFAHISDIHAVAGAARTIDGDVPGNARLPGLLDAIASTRPPYLLVTGDVTDGGQDPEWKTVLELLKPAAERIKVILAPGNHDLSSVFSGLLVLGGSSEDPRVEDFIRRQHSLFNGLNDSTGASLASSFDKAPSRESSQYRNAQKNVLACFTNCETERISAGAFLTPPPASQSTQAVGFFGEAKADQ
jgi:Calcineurin-like phosphoesterase